MSDLAFWLLGVGEIVKDAARGPPIIALPYPLQITDRVIEQNARRFCIGFVVCDLRHFYLYYESCEL